MARQLDATDIQLIRLVRRKARVSNREAARLLGVSEFNVRRRLAALEDSGLLRFGADIDYKQLGFSTVVFLTVECELAELGNIAQELASQPEIQFICVTTGAVDIIASCVCSSEEHLLKFLIDCVGKIKGIRRVQTSHVLSELKHFYQTDPPFEKLDSNGESENGSRPVAIARKRRGTAGGT